jgi:hypothetical protein
MTNLALAPLLPTDFKPVARVLTTRYQVVFTDVSVVKASYVQLGMGYVSPSSSPHPSTSTHSA